MSVYIVNYDLNCPGQDYEKLFKAIQSFTDYHHLMKSTWGVYSTKTAKGVFEFLGQYMDDTDRLFVSEFTENSWWYLDKGAATWLDKYRNQF